MTALACVESLREGRAGGEDDAVAVGRKCASTAPAAEARASDMARHAAVSLEIARARTVPGRLVVGIEELAGVDREAAAADAGREPVAERLESGDALVDVVTPAAGQPLPVAAGRGAVRGKGRKSCTDPSEGNSRRAARLDQRDPPKDGPLVSALVSSCSARDDQAFLLVEAES
jgi:hypothetical protein